MYMCIELIVRCATLCRMTKTLNRLVQRVIALEKKNTQPCLVALMKPGKLLSCCECLMNRASHSIRNVLVSGLCEVMARRYKEQKMELRARLS